jgi:hypothetical protein
MKLSLTFVVTALLQLSLISSRIFGAELSDMEQYTEFSTRLQKLSRNITALMKEGRQDEADLLTKEYHNLV